jgi:hypothetical protein
MSYIGLIKSTKGIKAQDKNNIADLICQASEFVNEIDTKALNSHRA